MKIDYNVKMLTSNRMGAVVILGSMHYFIMPYKLHTTSVHS